VSTEPLEAVAALARMMGVHSVARDAGELATDLEDPALRAHEARRLCLRLEQHLLEERRALTRTGDEPRRHLDAITACMIAFDQVVASMRDRFDGAALRSELEAERRKLIMGHKADLLAELDERVLHSAASKQDLLAEAAAMADELGHAVLRTWSRGLRARSDQRVAAHIDEVIRRVRSVCADHADAVLTPAFSGVTVMTTVETQSFERMPPVPVLRWTWLISEAGVRERARTAAGERLVALLERESARVVEGYLRYHATACEQVETSMANALDQLAQSASVANARARTAKAAGCQAVAQAHERIDACLRRLDEEQRRLG